MANATFEVDVGGVTYEVDAPDENTAWKWANATHKSAQAVKPSQSQAAPVQTKQQRPLTKDNPNIIDRAIINYLSDKPKLTNYLEKEIGQATPFGRVVQGAADLPLGVIQLGMNAVGLGDKINTELAAINERTNALRGPDAGFDWYRLLGGVANPAPIMALSKLPIATTALGKSAQGGGLGALFGAGSPVLSGDNYWSDKAMQTGGGAALGAAIPPLTSLLQSGSGVVRNVIDPLLPGGIQRSSARLANTAAGPRRADVIAALESAKPIVPNSPINAGQAAIPSGSAEFAALQKAASERLPSEYLADDAAAQAARLSAVRSVGKTPETLDAAITGRAATANVNYGEAYKQVVKGNEPLEAIYKNPFVQDVLPDAFKLAKANGINPTENLTEFLHLVKIGLDKQLTKTGDTALSNAEKAAVQGAKKTLLSWVAKNNPQYDMARQVFAEQSKPINQMQIGQYLENKLTAPVGVGERAASFSQAVNDAPTTIMRATTGGPRFEKLSQVLTPEQEASIRGVASELNRNATFEEMAARGRPEISRLIGENIPQAPPTGMFKPVLSAVRSWVNRLLSGATDDVMHNIAREMRDPKRFAVLMKSSTPEQRQQIAEAIVKYQGLGQGAIMAQQQ